MGQIICKNDCSAGSYIVSDKSACTKCAYGSYSANDALVCFTSHEYYNRQVEWTERKTSGKCSSSNVIKSLATCSEAATYLGFDDKTAEQWTTRDRSDYRYYPFGCYYRYGSLYFNNYGHYGSCSSYQVCLCTIGSETGGRTENGPKVICQAGTYQDQSQQTTCKICSIGTYQDELAASSCKTCNVGTFSSSVRASSCQTCQPSEYQDQTKQASCKTCVSGMYQDQISASLCKECSSGTYSLASASSCPFSISSCPVGTYAIRTASCDTCGIGKYLNEIGKSKEVSCAEDCDYINQYLNDSSLTKRDWKCQSCPLGGYCTGVINWSKVRPKYGWWRLHDIDTENINSPPNCLQTEENRKRSQPTCVFQKCLYPHACQGAPNPNRYTIDGTLIDAADEKSNFTETCDATQGYSNNCTDENNQPSRCRLCATCIGTGNQRTGNQRYKRTGGSTRCKLCPDPVMNKVWLGVGFIVMVIGSAVMVYMEITSEASEGETSDVVKKIIGKFSF